MTMALKRKAIPSPSYSSRGGAKVRLIVIHTAEGATTIESLGSWFANASNQVSSHTGIDDQLGVIGEYVRRDYKAWTAAGANPVAVQTELCAFAKWDIKEWNKHPNMLENCARWIAEEAAYFNIPITRLSPTQAQGSSYGVCQHVDLGSWGGGHYDCGSSFPMDSVLNMAREGSQPAPEEDEMGYPQWFWDWVNWYMTTERDPSQKPKDAPATIPQWAWDGQKLIQKQVADRYGMIQGERDWIDWLAANKKGERPNVPQTIPNRWWKDNEWAVGRGGT